MKKKIKVLHLIPGYGGGISSHVKNILKGIDSNVVEISIASFDVFPENYVELIKKKDGRFYKLRNVRINNIFSCIKEYRNIIKNNNFDVVHMHLSPLQVFYFSILSVAFGVKRRIAHAHIAKVNKQKSIFSKIGLKLDQILMTVLVTDLVSCSTDASIYRFGEKAVKNKKIMHIPNSINEDIYFNNNLNSKYEEKLRLSLDVERYSLILGHVGFFGEQKNHDFMLRIAKKMQSKKINFLLLFIGEGYNYNKYKTKASKMGLESNVKFLGRRDDVFYLYRVMNVSLLPSFYEGLPTVTIETQAAGTPTVISDTISSEVDMGLGMVERVSLDTNVEEWIKKIIDISKIKVPSDKIRRESIEKKNFTIEKSAKLYTDFLEKKISHFEF